MRKLRWALGVAISGGVCVSAAAFPDGAPWGAVDPDADESCATCHSDLAPERNSSALTMAVRRIGRTEDLVEIEIRLDDPDAITLGFALAAETDGEKDGKILSDLPWIETRGAAARSIEPQAPAPWTVQWVPSQPHQSIELRVAVVASNDDASSFGDRAHFNSWTIPSLSIR